MNNAIELAKAAMREAVALHVAMEQQRFLAWKSSPAKGRKPYAPFADNEAICATCTDLFETMVEAVRREASPR